MSRVENVGYILPQGDLKSMKGKYPSGYVLVSGFWPKTFRTHEAAVAYASKKGVQVKSRIPEEVRRKAETLLKVEEERAARQVKSESPSEEVMEDLFSFVGN